MWLLRKVKHFFSDLTRNNKRSNRGRAPRKASSSSNNSRHQLKRHGNTRGQVSKNLSVHKSPRQKRAAQIVIYLVLLTIAVWIVLFSWISDVESNHVEIAEQAQQRLEQTSRLRWATGALDLEKFLIQRNPQYSQISVSQPIFSRTLHIKAVDSDVALQWRSGGRTLSLSNEGVAIKQLDEPLEDVSLISDQTNLNYQPGDRVASPELVLFLLELTDQNKKDFEFTAISLSNSRVVRVSLEKYNFRLILSTDIEPQAQLSSLKQLLEQGSVPSRYVDTTIPGRLFWL